MLLSTGRFYGRRVATAPLQFQINDWSVADLGTAGDIRIRVISLPSDGGSAITDLEYQVDGGSWVSLAGTTAGDYTVSGLTDNVEVDVAIRAVNAIGAGTASATKAVTPTSGIADPTAITGCVLWLDPTTIAASHGGNVTAWADQSASATTQRRPRTHDL